MKVFVPLFAIALHTISVAQTPPSPPPSAGYINSRVQQTIGDRLRSHELQARTSNAWLNPPMRTVDGWQPSQTVNYGAVRVVNGQQFVYISPGTTAATGSGPALGSALSQYIVDGSTYCIWWGPNTEVTADPNRSQTPFSASLAVTAGQQITAVQSNNQTYIYSVTIAGNLGTTAPSGTGASIASGTSTLTYYGLWQANPYGSNVPDVAYSSGAPSGYTSIYYPSGISSAAVVMQTLSATPVYAGYNYHVGDTLSQQYAYAPSPGSGLAVNGISALAVVAGGTGYHLGDVGTVTGGTYSTQGAYIVTAVTGTTVTAVAPYNSGVYSAIPSGTLTTVPTTGTGTGLTVGGTFPTAGGVTNSTPILPTFTVNGVNSNGGITSVSITHPGAYTQLPSGIWFPTSTSGSGSGATFLCTYTPPFWCELRGANINGINGFSTLYATTSTYQSAPNGPGNGQHFGIDFVTDAPTFSYYAPYGMAENGLIIDGKPYCRQTFTYNSAGSGGWYTVGGTTPLSAGKHRIRIDNTDNPSDQFGSVGSIAVQPGYQVWAPGDSDTIHSAIITDSLGVGSADGPWIANNSTNLRLGQLLGQEMSSYALGGTGNVNRGGSAGVSTDCFATRIYQAMVQLVPDLWLIGGSVNDYGLSGITQAVTSELQLIRGLCPAWVPSTIYTNAQIVSKGGNLYIATSTTGTSAASGGPTGLGTGIVDGSITWNALGPIPNPSTAPIFFFGIWPASSYAGLESSVAAGVSAFADPLGTTFFDPLYNRTTGLPIITNTYNNNPAPSGLTMPTAVNFYTYVSNSVPHPCDRGTEYYAQRLADDFRTIMLPMIR